MFIFDLRTLSQDDNYSARLTMPNVLCDKHKNTVFEKGHPGQDLVKAKDNIHKATITLY